MAKTIVLTTKDGEEYTLEFSRETVKDMENSGFRANEIDEKPVSTLPKLFAGAFAKNHRGVKRRVVDELFDMIPGKMEFLNALAEMYNETVESMLDDPAGEKGNAKWVKNW